MDVALSLAVGLGLRVYLLQATSPTSFIASAVLGLWEGVVVHQLSFHPPAFALSPPLDHYLALGLRLALDLLIARNWARVIMVGIFTAIGIVVSESISPTHLTSLSHDPRKLSSRHGRDKERRRRQSRSAPLLVPSHVRMYRAPSASQSAPPGPDPQTSTPVQPTLQLDTNVGPSSGQPTTSPNFQPPSPPSFFLHAGNEPSPFPESPLSPKHTALIAQIPSRPRSALAFYEEGEKGMPPEQSSGPSRSPFLPTPPDSTIRERTMDSRVDRLSTIDEITSRSEHVTGDIEQGETEGDDNYILVSHGGGPPLPIPNPTSQYVHADDGTPVASVAPSAAPSAIPLPVPPIRYRCPGPPSDVSDELRTPGQRTYDFEPDSDPDELRTPPASYTRIGIAAAPPNPTDGSSRPENGLFPLWDSQLLAQDRDSNPAPETSISTYAILQPPVQPVPLGTFLDAATTGSEIPRPLSPSVASEAESVLSTRIPIQLLEHADDLRRQAIEEGKELDRLRGELKKAQWEKRPRDALFLRGDIQNAEARIQKLHERAAKRYFAGRNNLQKPDTIDVHGLKPMEALQKTEQAFRDLLRNGKSTLNVIVGKGIHSKGRVPVIKNYIITEMQRRLIPCRVDPDNLGILILTLPPASPTDPSPSAA